MSCNRCDCGNSEIYSKWLVEISRVGLDLRLVEIPVQGPVFALLMLFDSVCWVVCVLVWRISPSIVALLLFIQVELIWVVVVCCLLLCYSEAQFSTFY